MKFQREQIHQISNNKYLNKIQNKQAGPILFVSTCFLAGPRVPGHVWWSRGRVSRTRHCCNVLTWSAPTLVIILAPGAPETWPSLAAVKQIHLQRQSIFFTVSMIRLICSLCFEQLHVKAKHVGKSTGSVWAGVVTTGLVTAFPGPSHMWSSHRVQLQAGPDTPCCRPGVLTHNTWQYQILCGRLACRGCK